MWSRKRLVLVSLLSLIAAQCWGCRASRMAVRNIGAAFSHNINNGLAISLNSFQAYQRKMIGSLPSIRLRGVLFDRKKNDAGTELEQLVQKSWWRACLLDARFQS